MKTKLISALLAVVCATSLTAAAAPQVETSQPLIKYEEAVNFCRGAYTDYRKTKKFDMLHNGMGRLSKVNQMFVGYTCAAYAEGFVEGRESRVSTT